MLVPDTLTALILAVKVAPPLVMVATNCASAAADDELADEVAFKPAFSSVADPKSEDAKLNDAPVFGSKMIALNTLKLVAMTLDDFPRTAIPSASDNTFISPKPSAARVDFGTAPSPAIAGTLMIPAIKAAANRRVSLIQPSPKKVKDAQDAESE